jgi:hypothetical protein
MRISDCGLKEIVFQSEIRIPQLSEAHAHRAGEEARRRELHGRELALFGD